MASKSTQAPQNPLILRSHRLMEAFAKSDDERDFYLDRFEGFIIYIDLDKDQKAIEAALEYIKKNKTHFTQIPKLTYYENKKIMEGFIYEKVYDIDTKEKLLDIIQSKEAKDHFIEFLQDHHTELEKWQQYYQERSRVRIIEWLRGNGFEFVFEEDLDLGMDIIEKLKKNLFETKVNKDILNARKSLQSKAKTYYSSEALNPRPKRGRPPKQVMKTDSEPQMTLDTFISVPPEIRPFLFLPEVSLASSALSFSSKFDQGDQLLLGKKPFEMSEELSQLESLNKKLAQLKTLSGKSPYPDIDEEEEDFDDSFSEEDEFDEEDEDVDLEEGDEDTLPPTSIKKKAPPPKKSPPLKKSPPPKKVTKAKNSPPPSKLKKPSKKK